MTKNQLLELIQNGENSYVEFKRFGVTPASLAKEISALLNMSDEGVILLGVEDDGSISGIPDDLRKVEEWVMNVAQDRILPLFIPLFQTIKMDNGLVVGIISLRSYTSSKPYKAKNGKYWTTYIRVGSTSRTASFEQEGRLYLSASERKYETKPIQDMGIESLDMSRIENFFRSFLKISIPERNELFEWQKILLNSDLLTDLGDNRICTTVAGLLLFGSNPYRRLSQSGITAFAFPKNDKDYNITEEERIRGPVVSLFSENGDIIETGVIDRAVEFVHRNMGGDAWLEGGRRIVKKSLPLDAVREAIINAVTHRDYAYAGTDIELSLYANRLEVISPGIPPNGVTVEKMKQGFVRVTRNSLINDILQKYDYVDHAGMGVRLRIVETMYKHNGTEPDLVVEPDRFKVCLWKSQ
ncbi:MAG: putative DNA binding domain-containing protein [Bacteroidetes bacterium]|nr:putative DNA binding domain-containing protein [Bacteroidota bacterium]